MKGVETDIREIGGDTRLRLAVAAWKDALDPERVHVAGERLEQAQRATFAFGSRSVLLLEPENRDEVAACLRIAGRYRIPVHPISGGRNWGYGSRLPPRDGAVLLSLARMKRIVAFSEELAYATIEPGVTFRQLAAYMRERGSSLLPPMTGTDGEASIIGNVLQRGIGKGPYEDMAAHSCGYETVLASGEVVYSGLAGDPDASAAALQAEPAGPSLQGLFQQSRLGIVTRMTIRLEPAPEWRQRLMFPLHSDTELEGAIEALRELLLRSGKGMQAEVLNDYRLLMMSGSFPFETSDPRQSLSRSALAEAIAPLGGGRWFGCATLWADSEEELACRRSRLEGALEAIGVTVLEEARGRGIEAPPFQESMRSVYWRKPGAVPDDPDPDRDRCGVIWLAPVLPMLGGETAAVMERVERLMLDRGFEPSISLRMLGGRSIHAIIGLFYDRDEPEADERAASCHAAVRELLDRNGYYPYRLGLLDGPSIPGSNEGTAALHDACQRFADPHGVLSTSDSMPDDHPEPSLFAGLDFGVVSEGTEIGRLRQAMNASMIQVAASLPEPLGKRAKQLFLELGPTDGDFMRLFYVPMWSFLHHLGADAGLQSHSVSQSCAQDAHAMALLLHLLDDHLCDGQLPATMTLLQLRTEAWQRFRASSLALSEQLGGDAGLFDEMAGLYLASVERAEDAADLDAYEQRFRWQMSTWTLVPRLIGYAAGGQAGAEALVGILEEFGVAWRLLDDIQDFYDDACKGERTSVWLELDREGRRSWDACHASFKATGACDAVLLDRLNAAIGNSGCMYRLLVRIGQKLQAASESAALQDWPHIAHELEQCRNGIPIFSVREGELDL